jgi:hypothetical protein
MTFNRQVTIIRCNSTYLAHAPTNFDSDNVSNLVMGWLAGVLAEL